MAEPLEVTDAEGLIEGHDFVADLHVLSILDTVERGVLWAPVTEGVRSSAGAASVGVLALLYDVIASAPALAAVRPDWTATQSLALHATGWVAEGPAVVDASVVRAGKKVVVVAAEVWDGRGIDDPAELLATFAALPDGVAGTATRRPGGGAAGDPVLAARGLLTFARLPGSAAGRFAEGHDPKDTMGKLQRRWTSGEVAGTVWDRIGVREVDGTAGVVELPLIPYITNSIGTINGGALAMMIERGAEVMRPGLVATDLSIQYLSQTKVGPARTRGSVSRDARDHSVVAIEVLDHGNDDHVLALATVTLQTPPS